MTPARPDLQPDAEFLAARGHVESLGVPTTPSLMVLSTRVVRTVRRWRASDKHIGDAQLAREATNSEITAFGKREAVDACAENDRLRAVRMPTNPEMPTNPSVEDLCEFVLRFYITKVAKREVAHLPHPLPLDDPDGVAAERGQRPHHNDQGHELP